jgi:hypothetical protein
MTVRRPTPISSPTAAARALSCACTCKRAANYRMNLTVVRTARYPERWADKT